MAHFVYVYVAAVLPTKNVEWLKALLSTTSGVGNKKEYFQVRGCVYDFKTKSYNKYGMSLVNFCCDCDWSMWSCFLDKSNKFNTVPGCTRLTLNDAIKHLGVKRFVACGSCFDCDNFEEVAFYDFNKGDKEITYSSRDGSSRAGWPIPGDIHLHIDDKPMEEEMAEIKERKKDI